MFCRSLKCRRFVFQQKTSNNLQVVVINEYCSQTRRFHRSVVQSRAAVETGPWLRGKHWRNHTNKQLLFSSLWLKTSPKVTLTFE